MPPGVASVLAGPGRPLATAGCSTVGKATCVAPEESYRGFFLDDTAMST